jgi:hypothetical protein
MGVWRYLRNQIKISSMPSAFYIVKVNELRSKKKELKYKDYEQDEK